MLQRISNKKRIIRTMITRLLLCRSNVPNKAGYSALAPGARNINILKTEFQCCQVQRCFKTNNTPPKKNCDCPGCRDLTNLSRNLLCVIYVFICIYMSLNPTTSFEVTNIKISVGSPRQTWMDVCNLMCLDFHVTYT